MINTIIRWIMFLIAIFMCVLALLLSPIGLKVSLFTTTLFLPGKIHYQNSSGLVLGPIEISNLRYQYRGIDLNIKKLRWQWNLSGLFQKQIHVQSLILSGVYLHLPAQQDKINMIQTLMSWIKDPNHTQVQFVDSVNATISKVKEFHWPLHLNITHAKIHDITITQTNNPIIYSANNITFINETNQGYLKLYLTGTLIEPNHIAVNTFIVGTPNNYQFKLSAANSGFKLNLQGQGNSNQVSMTTKDSEIAGISITGDALLGWAPTLTWDINLTTQHINLNALFPQLSKNINLDVHSKGEMRRTDWNAQFNGVFTAPQNNINVQISFQQQWQINWNIRSGAIQNIFLPLRGSLISQGSWTGIFPNFSTQGNLQANSISFQKYHAQNINLNWLFDARNNNNGIAKLSATNLNIPTLTINQLQLELSGNPQNHVIQGHMKSSLEDINWVVKGQWLNNVWSTMLTQFSVKSKTLDTLNLMKPTPMTITKNTWNLDSFCLTSKTNEHICLDTSKSPDRLWHLNIVSPKIDLEKFSSFVGPNITLHGNAKLNLTASGNKTGLKQMELQLLFLPGTFSYNVGTTHFHTSYNTSILRGYFDKKGLHNDLRLNLVNNDFLDMHFSLPNFNIAKWWDQNQIIDGNIRVKIHNINFLSAIIPNTVIPQGAVDANLKLEGPLNNLMIQGKAELVNGQIQIPPLNITLQKVNVYLVAANGELQYHASAYSANQPLFIKGITKIEPNWPTQATIEGNNFLFINTKEYVLYGSPNLTVNIIDHRLNLQGTINIPRGEVKPYDFRNTVVLPEDEVVFIGKPLTSKVKSPWLISTRVTLSIGEDVDLDTVGLVGKLYGQITIIAAPEQTTVGVGRIGLHDGTFSIFGSTLMIDPSSYIQFTNSPLNNPNLNLRATREITTYGSFTSRIAPTRRVVGVEVSGTFKSPKPTFFSIPSDMTQGDILSYLLFNAAPNASTSANLALFLQAIEAIKPGGGGLAQATKTVDQVKQGLGFSELGIESQTAIDPFGNNMDQQTAFVVGKNISNRFYIRFSRGIGKITPGLPTYEWTLSYFLTHNWSIQVYRNSLGSGGDLLYTVERN